MSDVSKDRAELEYGLIGCMIHDNGMVGKILPILSEEDFGLDPLRSIFRAIRNVFNRNAPVDRVTVLHELGDDGYGEILDAALRYRTPKGNAELYAGVLRDRARRDEIHALASDLSLAETPEEISALTEKINGLMAQRRTYAAISGIDAVSEFYDRHSEGKSPEFLDFGFPKLNKFVFSEAGDLIILAGEPSAGKTALASQMAVRLAEKHRVGFFTLETSREKLTDRIVSQMAKVPLTNIKKNLLGEQEWKAISEAGNEIGRLSFEIIPAAGMSVTDIRSFSLSRHYDVIIVDYLQIIRPTNGRTSRYEQVTEISMSLHTMAQENRIAVIALTQMSRPEKRGKDDKLRVPNMHDLRESGQIEQDADVVFLLYRSDPGNNSGSRRLKIGKNKENELSEIELAFDGSIQTFSESTPKWTPPQPKPKPKAPPMFEEMEDDGTPLPF